MGEETDGSRSSAGLDGSGLARFGTLESFPLQQYRRLVVTSSFNAIVSSATVVVSSSRRHVCSLHPAGRLTEHGLGPLRALSTPGPEGPTSHVLRVVLPVRCGTDA